MPWRLARAKVGGKRPRMMVGIEFLAVIKLPVWQEEGKDWDGGGGEKENYVAAMLVRNTSSIS
jgi:hypothetical protein